MEANKEEILKKHVSLYFSSHHDKSRWNGEGEHGGAEWHAHKPIAADIYAAMEEYAKQEVLSELQALVEMQCHPEYLKMAIIDRISEIKNPSQLP